MLNLTGFGTCLGLLGCETWGGFFADKAVLISKQCWFQLYIYSGMDRWTVELSTWEGAGVFMESLPKASSVLDNQIVPPQK